MLSFENVSEEVKKIIGEWRKKGVTQDTIVQWVKENIRPEISRDAIRKVIMDYDAGIVNSPISISDQVKQDIQIKSREAEANYYKRLYNESIKEAAEFEKIIQVAKEITNAIPAVKVHYAKPQILATSPQSVVAPLCDTHIGEKVDLAQMAGLNEYNMDIFNRRLYGWSDQVVNLVQLRKKYVDVPKLYVPMLGDMISGDIHLELTRTNLDNVMGQMIRGANLIAQALVNLSQHFDEVNVPCVVGNHGRMTIKPPAKDKFVDWDYLLFQWAAAFCRNQKNIKFEIPRSFMHVFSVEGKNVLIMHGDSIKMWQSIPAYGIIRAISQLRQTLQFRRGLEEDIEKLVKSEGKSSSSFVSLLASYFDTVLIGHFHTVSEFDIGTGEAYVCGCVKGADEYAFGRLHQASKPKQILLYAHPKYGFISKDIIFLDKYDKAERSFVDSLPDVWAEKI
ncbi:hypothetical protein HYS94_01895 [Candidatus Daviesbacteria bacterium]|nr:hypothetical protein [Candidatus Daviesbacteria bacterium]